MIMPTMRRRWTVRECPGKFVYSAEAEKGFQQYQDLVP
jgi:hypothetical protein